MALSKPFLTPQIDVEQENYLRMRVFLERATDVLRDVLTRELQKAYPGDFDPFTGILYNVLNIPAVRKNLLQLSKRNRLNASQKQILYPAGTPSSTAKVHDFDVTLTVLLLRNITTLNPSAKWDRPPSTDLSTEADIGRVKTYRNNHMHGAARLPAATFQSDFEGLKTVLLRLSKIYTEQDYDKVLIDPIQTSGVPTACQLMSVNLPRKDSAFFGREDLLTEIQQEIENNSQILLLTGMGGIGKTSIAVEMGHRMSEEGRDVLFLDMRHVENLDSVQLSLVQHYNPKMFLKEIYADRKNLFQKTLSDIKSATIVIFDNIDNLLRDQTLKKFLKLVQDMLKASKHISLVCTSRKSFDLTSVKVVKKHVPPLDDNSSTQLLLDVKTAPPTEREAGVLIKIAARCGHCPLALKLLASQIKEKGSERVLEKMEKKGVLEVANTEGLKPCFEISFDAMSDSEKDLFCSLYIFPVAFHLRDVSNILQMDEDECEDILDSLTSKSVVNRVSDQVYDLHPLLNAFSESQAIQFPDKKSMIEISYCKYYSDRAALLAVIFESSVPKFANERAAIILPHLLCSGKLLLKHLSQYLQNKLTSTTALDRDVDTDYEDFILRLLYITDVLKQLYLFNERLHLLKELADVLQTKLSNVHLKRQTSLHFSSVYSRVGDVLHAMGKYDDALTYLKKTLEIHEKLLGTNHTKTADSYYNIGVVLHGMGKYDDALTYLRKGLEIHEKVLGTNHSTTATSYSSIGHLLFYMGKDDDALVYQRKGLAIQEQLLGTKHPRTADLYSNIGVLLHYMGKFDDALTYQMKGLEIHEKVLGTNHPNTADAYSNYGDLLRKMGKYDDALKYHMKGLAIQEQILGKKHHHTAESYCSLGVLLHDMGKYDDALTYDKKSLEIYEELYGIKHTVTARSYTNIGIDLQSMGKYDDAQKYLKKSLAINKEQFQMNPTNTADAYSNYGGLLRDMGKYEDALTYYRKTLQIHEEVLGTNHTATAASYDNIGLVLHDMGKYNDALTYNRKSLEIREKLLGTKHTATARSLNSIGNLLVGMGKYDDALTYLKKSLEIREQLFGTQHIDISESYHNISLALQVMDKFDEALLYQKKSLEIREKVLGTKHPTTADSCYIIGLVLQDMGKFDDALTYHTKCIEIRKKLLGTHHTKTADSYNNIGIVLRKIGKYDDALTYTKKSLEIREKLLGTNHTTTAESYNNIGLVLHDMGKYNDALPYNRKSLEIRKKLLGTNHIETAESYSNTSDVLFAMDMYDAALSYDKESAKIREVLLGTKHTTTADSYGKIGVALHVMGNSAKSLKYFKKALDIFEPHYGVKHKKVYLCYQKIGLILDEVKLYRDGVFYLKKCASVQEELLGVTHQDTVDTCKMIGTVLIQMGQFAEAIKYFEKINWDIVIVQQTW